MPPKKKPGPKKKTTATAKTQARRSSTFTPLNRQPPPPPKRAPPVSRLPVYLDDEVLEVFGEHLRQGLPMATAATMAGVALSTARAWRARGKTELDRLEADPRAKPRATELLYAEFESMCRRARAEFEAAAVARINHAAQAGAWHADAWMLQRVLPKRYRDRAIVQGDPDKPIQHQHTHTFLDEARKVFAVPPGAPVPDKLLTSSRNDDDDAIEGEVIDD